MEEKKTYKCLNCMDEIEMKDVGQYSYDYENPLGGKVRCPFCGGNMERKDK